MIKRFFSLTLAFAGAHAAFAALIPIDVVPISGAGLGTINTALTFTSPGASSAESGCVAAGVGGAEVTGPGACPAGFVGGDELAINNTYSAASLGVTDFNNFQVIFSAIEPGNAADMGITVDSLALTLWDPATGLILDAKYTAAPYVITDADPGVGNAGYGFKLDAGDAADFNLLLANFPNLFIGVAANASDSIGGATAGPETISFRVTDATTVIPEPSTYALVGIAFAAVALLRRKLT
jgi:hypothetical protein